MASKADIKAGGAFVELFVKDGKFKQQIAGAQTTLKSLGTGIAAVGAGIAAAGAAVLAPLTAAVAHFTEAGGALNDMAQRTGLSASKLAFLNYAAEQTGAKIEDIETALKFAAKQGFSPENFGELAKQVAAIEDPAKRTARAMELFGKNGTMLLPMFAEITALQERWNRLGIGPSEESIRLADELGDLWGDLKAGAAAIVFELGAALAPAMKELVALAVPFVSEITKWVKQNPQLVVGVAALAAAAVALGTALVVVGGTIAALAAGLAALLTEAAAIVGTLVLIGIVVAAAVVAFLRWTTIGQNLFRFFKAGLKGLLDEFNKTFKGVGDAIKAGDLETAWKIALMGMTAQWQKFVSKVLTDLADLVEKVVPFAGILGGPALTFDAGTLREAARGYRLDAGLNESNARMLGSKFSGQGQGGRPQDYPLAMAGAGIIGTNSFSALRGAGVIGAKNPMHDTLKKQLRLDMDALKVLIELNRKAKGPPKWK